jgi:tetratricopeptide (TPR) repeat protein
MPRLFRSAVFGRKEQVHGRAAAPWGQACVRQGRSHGQVAQTASAAASSVRSVTPPDLPSLLASGEHATFHGKPAAAVGVLEQAVVLAQSQGLVAEVAAAAWLLGVALGAGGRYGGALTVLSPLVDAGNADGATPERRLFGALSGATIASIHRQLGRHAIAREADLRALELTDGTGEAAFDALLGLASDAVGLDDAEEAGQRLSQADAVLPGRGDEWWRQRVRLGWARAEVALLEGRTEDASAHAAEAVQRAEDSRAPRHVSKGLLLLGLAQVSHGDDEAASSLRRSATFAESLGCLPLVWPSRALLGALIAGSDRVESDRSLSAARAAVLAIAADLPPGVRGEWLARPDITALLEG